MSARFVRTHGFKGFRFLLRLKFLFKKILNFPPPFILPGLSFGKQRGRRRGIAWGGHKAGLGKERRSAHPAAGLCRGLAARGVGHDPPGSHLHPCPPRACSGAGPFVPLLSRGRSSPLPAGMRETPIRTMTPGSPPESRSDLGQIPPSRRSDGGGSAVTQILIIHRTPVRMIAGSRVARRGRNAPWENAAVINTKARGSKAGVC